MNKKLLSEAIKILINNFKLYKISVQDGFTDHWFIKLKETSKVTLITNQ